MVVLLLANGFEELEALTSVDVLRRRNIDIRTVSVTSDKLVTGTHGIQVMADLTSDDVPLEDISILVLPGGMPGVKNLDASKVTHTFIDATLKNGGHLAAICAAPSIFGKHGMLTNIKATCFPGFEKELLNAVVVDERVVTDGIFTTAKDFTCSMEFANEIANIYEERYGMEIELVVEEGSDEKTEPATDSGNAVFEDEVKEYFFPDISLLSSGEDDTDCAEEAKEVAEIIINTLESFNVKAEISGYEIGPRVIRYAILPAKGTKVTSITRIFSDICLNLAKEGVRMEAPIPGRSAIGIEVPRKHPRIVKLRELMENEKFSENGEKTLVSVGQSITGENVYGNLSKYPHVMVCGSTGMGKSVLINSMLISTFYKATPDEVRFILIDPKMVEFTAYNNIPNLLVPVITDANEASEALLWAVEEMDRRYALLEAHSVRNIDAYNEKANADPSLGKALPKIVIVIDELADLMMLAKDPIEDLIMRLAQKARAAGIHLIIGTQRPSVKVITGAIKANIPSRICLKVSSQIDSRTVLDMAGAEKLLNNGDMLYWPIDKTMPLRVQGAFVSDSEVIAVTDYLRSLGCRYDKALTARIKSASHISED